MVKGEPPPTSQNPLEIIHSIATNSTPVVARSRIRSSMLSDYLACTLEVDVEERLDAQRLLQVKMLFKKDFIKSTNANFVSSLFFSMRSSDSQSHVIH